MNRESLDALPTGRTIQGLGQLVVGISLSIPDVGGSRAMQQTYMSTHGMTTANTTILVDGMMVNGLQADGAVQSYFNDAMNQEVSYQTSGIGAETSAGGVRLNMIPREGGNRFTGSFFSSWKDGAWQGDNFTQEVRDRGLTSPSAIDKIMDFNFSQGGPIKKDKLWFFATARYWSVDAPIANTQYPTTDNCAERGGSLTQNASGAEICQGIDDQFIKSGLIRLTYQVTPTQQAVRLLRRDRQVPRARDVHGRRPRDGVGCLELARVSHDGGEVHLHDHQPAAVRSRLLEQHRELHQRVPGRHLHAARVGGLVRLGTAP